MALHCINQLRVRGARANQCADRLLMPFKLWPALNRGAPHAPLLVCARAPHALLVYAVVLQVALHAETGTRLARINLMHENFGPH